MMNDKDPLDILKSAQSIIKSYNSDCEIDNYIELLKVVELRKLNENILKLTEELSKRNAS